MTTSSAFDWSEITNWSTLNHVDHRSHKTVFMSIYKSFSMCKDQSGQELKGQQCEHTRAAKRTPRAHLSAGLKLDKKCPARKKEIIRLLMCWSLSSCYNSLSTGAEGTSVLLFQCSGRNWWRWECCLTLCCISGFFFQWKSHFYQFRLWSFPWQGNKSRILSVSRVSRCGKLLLLEQSSALNLTGCTNLWRRSLPVELKDQVMLRLKLLEALMDMSRFLLACTQRKETRLC